MLVNDILLWLLTTLAHIFSNGGVGRSLADALAKLGNHTRLESSYSCQPYLTFMNIFINFSFNFKVVVMDFELTFQVF